MNVTGFVLLSSSEKVERKLADVIMFGANPIREKLSLSFKSPSEFILTEVLGLNIEYTVESGESFRSLYTIGNKDFVTHWSGYINLFYGAGIDMVGLNYFVEGMHVWFDLQGKTGRKGWLMKIQNDSDAEKVWGSLSENERTLLGLEGFQKKSAKRNEQIVS